MVFIISCLQIQNMLSQINTYMKNTLGFWALLDLFGSSLKAITFLSKRCTKISVDDIVSFATVNKLLLGSVTVRKNFSAERIYKTRRNWSRSESTTRKMGTICPLRHLPRRRDFLSSFTDTKEKETETDNCLLCPVRHIASKVQRYCNRYIAQ